MTQAKQLAEALNRLALEHQVILPGRASRLCRAGEQISVRIAGLPEMLKATALTPVTQLDVAVVRNGSQAWIVGDIPVEERERPIRMTRRRAAIQSMAVASLYTEFLEGAVTFGETHNLYLEGSLVSELRPTGVFPRIRYHIYVSAAVGDLIVEVIEVKETEPTLFESTPIATASLRGHSTSWRTQDLSNAIAAANANSTSPPLTLENWESDEGSFVFSTGQTAFRPGRTRSLWHPRRFWTRPEAINLDPTRATAEIEEMRFKGFTAIGVFDTEIPQSTLDGWIENRLLMSNLYRRIRFKIDRRKAGTNYRKYGTGFSKALNLPSNDVMFVFDIPFAGNRYGYDRYSLHGVYAIV